MFDLLEDFVSKKFIALNSSLASPVQIKQVQSRVDPRSNPTSEKAIHYEFAIEDTLPEETELQVIDEITIRIDFLLLHAGKDRKFYQMAFDNYVWGLRMELSRNTTDLYLPYENVAISTEATITGISRVAVSNADRFDGNIYRPTITARCLIVQNL